MTPETLIAAARERICNIGPDDHGHTDCWIIANLLDLIAHREAALDILRAAWITPGVGIGYVDLFEGNRQAASEWSARFRGETS